MLTLVLSIYLASSPTIKVGQLDTIYASEAYCLHDAAAITSDAFIGKCEQQSPYPQSTPMLPVPPAN